jgi:NAD(P)-dependent dehydrogenase (short-subunit alcohol dehydrogenase family)
MTCPGISEYAASKHAINGFLRCIRLEFADTGSPVTTTGIYPWVINTGMFKGLNPTGIGRIFMPELDETFVS